LVNTIRSLEAFDPYLFTKRIDVIGVGATGSRITMTLARLGISTLHIWDFDTLEDHNLANHDHSLTPEDVGKSKVDAIGDAVSRVAGIEVVRHNARVDGSQRLGEVVFLLTDTMSSRREIWEAGIKYKIATSLMIETRMGKDNGRVYALNPCKPRHIRGWEDTLYSDEVAVVSACGTSISVGPTAEAITGFAVWQMVRWFDIERGAVSDTLDNELLISMYPPMVITRNFN
jgi:molybdopterin/thiamine biosynthesis adenylyltransferase